MISSSANVHVGVGLCYDSYNGWGFQHLQLQTVDYTVVDSGDDGAELLWRTRSLGNRLVATADCYCTGMTSRTRSMLH